MRKRRYSFFFLSVWLVYRCAWDSRNVQIASRMPNTLKKKRTYRFSHSTEKIYIQRTFWCLAKRAFCMLNTHTALCCLHTSTRTHTHTQIRADKRRTHTYAFNRKAENGVRKEATKNERRKKKKKIILSIQIWSKSKRIFFSHKWICIAELNHCTLIELHISDRRLDKEKKLFPNRLHFRQRPKTSGWEKMKRKKKKNEAKTQMPCWQTLFSVRKENIQRKLWKSVDVNIFFALSDSIHYA